MSGLQAKAKSAATNHGNKVVDELKNQLQETGTLARDAVTSSAWTYPLRGIVYLASHPKLYQPIMSALVKSLILSVVVLVACFILLYFPQVAVLAFVSGPLAFIAAVPLVLSEAYVIILFLSKTLYLDSATEDVFDATLLERGHEQLVSAGRELGTKRSGVTRALGQRVGAPLSRFSPQAIARYLISLPLNAIPGIGTGLFLLFNGSRSGPGHHARYFQLKKVDAQHKEEFVHKNSGAYTSFGTMALLLNLVPVVGIALSLSTATGAALWASDLERSNSLASMGSAETAPKPSRKEL